MTYGLATGLRGFRSSRLRVAILRREGDTVWVRTADLLDAGTPLTLRWQQIAPLGDDHPEMMHRSGLVSFSSHAR